MAKIRAMKSGGGSGSQTIEPLVPKLTASTASVISGGTFSSGKEAWKAFDRISDTSAENGGSGTNEWYVGYDFGQSVNVRLVELTTRTSYSSSNANKFQIWNGSSWETIINDMSAMNAAKTTFYFPIEGDAICTKARIYNAGASYDGFYEIQFYGYDA